jgi:hypothetical protein
MKKIPVLDKDRLYWFKVFLELGFIAVNQADEDAALKLFHAAEILNPESALPQAGIGYLHLHKLELKQACAVFKKILEKEPDNMMCKAFLGICTAMQPNHVVDGEKILDETFKKTKKDPGVADVHQLTVTAIDFVERFIKKTPGPAGK